MYKVTLKKQFRKDFALMKRRGMPLDELQTAITVLASGSTLAPRYKDHPLKGNYIGCRECHILPDWLLVYKIKDRMLELILIRTGSHSDLFKK